MRNHTPARAIDLLKRFDTRFLAVALATTACLLGAATAAPSFQASPSQAKSPESKADYPDLLIFKNGSTLACKILSETSSNVRVKASSSAGLAFETEYPKSDILKMTRGAPADKAKPESKDGGTTKESKPELKPDAVAKDPGGPAVNDPNKKKYYVLELTGKFGRDISQTPIREAMEDARKNGAETIIVVMENDWSLFKGMVEKGDEVGAFDELFRAEDMDGIFSDEVARWPKPPKVIFWVKKAMGGAAFLPLVSHDIYFAPDGKMGGIGNLTRMFGGMGDETVRQKQYSLRLGHAEGIANTGGYSPLLVRAMVVPEFVLSYKIEGGKPVLLERMPESTDEFLLTDDADEQKGTLDNNAQLARGEGNDSLTLTAKIANDLQVSKGTVETIDELLDKEGIARSAELIKGKSDRIMNDWRVGVENAQRDIRRLMEEADQVPQGNDFQGRTRARGQQKQIYVRVLSILRRYGEGLGKAQASQLEVELKRRMDNIDAEQQRDAQQQKKK